MPDIPSPWRELITFLIGGGAIAVLDRLLLYRQQRSQERLAHETASGENLERRVTATVKVIDIYQESADDFAERIRDLKSRNRTLERQVKELRQENELLRELKGKEIEGRGWLLPPGD